MKKLIVVLILTILLWGCSKTKDPLNIIRYDYLYRGENENWVAEFKLTGEGIFEEIDGTITYDNEVNKILNVTYKKDLAKLKPIKKIKITYESNHGKGTITQNFINPPKEKTFVLASKSYGAVGNEEIKVKVTITVDGKTETINLENVD